MLKRPFIEARHTRESEGNKQNEKESEDHDEYGEWK